MCGYVRIPAELETSAAYFAPVESLFRARRRRAALPNRSRHRVDRAAEWSEDERGSRAVHQAKSCAQPEINHCSMKNAQHIFGLECSRLHLTRMAS